MIQGEGRDAATAPSTRDPQRTSRVRRRDQDSELVALKAALRLQHAGGDNDRVSLHDRSCGWRIAPGPGLVTVP